LERDEPDNGRAASTAGDSRRGGRRDAAQRRIAMEPLRRKARMAEAAAARLAAEQQALDRSLIKPGAFGGSEMAEALKRRAELARLIAEAEAEWLAAEAEIERLTQG